MSKTIALCASHVLTGSQLTDLGNGCVLVTDGRIEKIMTQDDLKTMGSLDNIEVIDLGHRTLLPGMIECHNHIGMDARLAHHLEMMEHCECELTVTALNALKDDLISGVTTARSMGDRFYIDVHLRGEIQNGRVAGPNILAAGIGMRSMHGHGFVGLPHCGVENLRRTCRSNIARGVNMLKLFVTPGMPPISGDFVPHYLTREEIATVVREAASVNIPTAAHCIGGQGLADCLSEGVDVIEHAYSVTESDIELLLKHDSWVDLTSGIILDPSREEFLSERGAAHTRACREATFRRLEKLVKSGVKFTLGTDAYHGMLYREVEYAVELGASNLTAVQGVTTNAARMCRIDKATGSIAQGLAADLIAVESNPLDNVSALSQVAFVMKGGSIVKHS